MSFGIYKLFTFYIHPTACTDGEILLYNGSEVYRGLGEGTVLVCYSNNYGSVCDDYWDELEARVVCRQLGYNVSSSSEHNKHFSFLSRLSYILHLDSIPIRSSQFGAWNGSILLDQLLCTGSEASLLNCPAGEQLGFHNCDHSEDAGVRCDGKL